MKFACALVAALRLFSITEAADLRNQRDEYDVQVRQQPFGMIGKKISAKSYFATVTGVKKHSPAKNAGVQVGSQIMTINGVVVSADDWEDCFRIAKMPFTLTLRAPRSHDFADKLDKLAIEQAVDAAHDKDKDRLKKRLNKERRQKIERKQRRKNKKRRQKIERKKRRNVTVRERPFGIQFKKIVPSTLETWFPSLTGTLETCSVIVIGVVKDSPADKARVRVGSEIVAINGTEVTSNNWERHFDKAKLPFILTLKGGTNPLFAEPELKEPSYWERFCSCSNVTKALTVFLGLGGVLLCAYGFDTWLEEEPAATWHPCLNPQITKNRLLTEGSEGPKTDYSWNEKRNMFTFKPANFDYYKQDKDWKPMQCVDGNGQDLDGIVEHPRVTNSIYW